ncbi:hypothetical protein [Megasphaera sp. UBA4382]|uniref:hypothetical protein n=1 Tax=Megasphaera sp. UBA4382 TaxID=1946850 RepID=UPI0025C2F579|nr:hypothetical protein [Megasphaera sp. UBA4382]
MEGVIAALWRLTTTRQMVPDRVRQVKEAASRAASGKEEKEWQNVVTYPIS